MSGQDLGGDVSVDTSNGEGDGGIGWVRCRWRDVRQRQGGEARGCRWRAVDRSIGSTRATSGVTIRLVGRPTARQGGMLSEVGLDVSIYLPMKKNSLPMYWST